jgi:hypothetical protein
MAGNNLTGCLSAQPAVQVCKRRGSHHVLFGNAVHGHIVGIEVVSRVDQPHLRVYFPTAFKCHHANLANAAHARVGCFKVYGDEAHSSFLSQPWDLLYHPPRAAKVITMKVMTNDRRCAPPLALSSVTSHFERRR